MERERIGRLADRALRWVRLRAKPNSEKKVAIIYVSGIGKGKITAASLNVPRSLIRFLKGMQEAGYRVEGLASDADALLAEMLHKGRNISDAPRITGKSNSDSSSSTPRAPWNQRPWRREITRSGRNSRTCLLYTSPSPRDGLLSRMPSSA